MKKNGVRKKPRAGSRGKSQSAQRRNKYSHDPTPEKAASYWSQHNALWFRDRDLRSVIFMDECASGREANFFRYFNFIKAVKFPDQLRNINYPDTKVLESLLIFISQKPDLLRENLDFYFVTKDIHFEEDADYEHYSENYKLRIHVLLVPDNEKDRKKEYKKFLCGLISNLIGE